MTLSRKDEDYVTSIRAVKLYLEDILLIVDAMRAPDQPVALAIDGATTDDPLDLLELEKVRELSITSPAVQVTLMPTGCYVSAFAGVAHARATAAQIELHLHQRRRKIISVILTRPFIIVVAIMAFGLAWVPFLDALKHRPGVRYSIEAVSYCGTAIFLAYLFWTDRRVKVVPQYRRLAPSFWKRKRDDLVVNAIFLVLGVVIGHLVS